MFFKNRIISPEIMDDFNITDSRIDQAISELKVINKYLGGTAITKIGIKELSENGDKANLTVLDLGSGGSDVFDFHLKEIKIELFALDKNIRAVKFLKRNRPGLNIVCADAKLLPFRRRSFDIVHMSLFMHHLDDNEIINCLESVKNISKKGILINDLRRNLIAFLGIKILTFLFSKSKMVKNDGPLSVRKGFRKKELQKYFKGIFSKYIIKRKWAFRWMILLQNGEDYAAS